MCLHVLGINHRAIDGVSVLASNGLIRGIRRVLAQRGLGLQIRSWVYKSFFRIGEFLLLSRSTHLLLLRVMAD
jgi:hypothetical protein